MATITPQPARAANPPRDDSPPPLENGDRMTRVEFERRYNAMPNVRKAELIEGIVYMPSPVSFSRHGVPHSLVIGWLFAYWAATPGVGVATDTSVRLDLDNEPQPDAVLLIKPDHGGQAKVSADDYIEGAPELVIEISSSTASIDLNQKLNVYRRNGVREYIVWRVRDNRIDWFSLQDGEFVRLDPDPDNINRSRVFPGLWLGLEAMLRNDAAGVLLIAQQGTTNAEHGRFVEELAARKR